MVNWTEVEAIATQLSRTHKRERHWLRRAATQTRAAVPLGGQSRKQLGFFQSENFTTSRRRLAADRLGENGISLRPWDVEEPPVSAFEVLDFYEHVGLLVKKGHLEIYDVWHTFYEWAQPVYVDMQTLIESPESAYADHYADLRKLMRAMDDIQIKRMHEKNANHWALWTPERILQHYRYELEVSGHSGRSKHSASRAGRSVRPASDPNRSGWTWTPGQTRGWTA